MRCGLSFSELGVLAALMFAPACGGDDGPTHITLLQPDDSGSAQPPVSGVHHDAGVTLTADAAQSLDAAALLDSATRSVLDARSDQTTADASGPSTAQGNTPITVPCEDLFYFDADGDGFGDNAHSTAACKAPAAYVADNTDCYDRNEAAHPGQTEYFKADRGDGSYDYDCDGRETCVSPADAPTRAQVCR